VTLRKKLAAAAKKLKTQSFVLLYACKDPETPWYAKAIAAIVVAYAFSPIDLIPDFIPVLGLLDDLIIVPLGIALAIRLVPREVMERSRRKAQERVDNSPPANWVMGAIIIALWALVIAVVIFAVVRRMRIR
jgi:uncharacterized membrane protein YkvA (DUF1232 family)